MNRLFLLREKKSAVRLTALQRKSDADRTPSDVSR